MWNKTIVYKMEGYERKMSGRKDLAWTIGGFAIDGDYVWFVPYMLNVLCKYNMKTNYMEETLFIPKPTCGFAGFYNVIKTKESVIMIPAFEKNIYMYHIEEKKMEKVEIPNEKCTCEKFQYATIYNDELFLFPVSYSCVLKVSLVTYVVEKISMDNENANMFNAAIGLDDRVFLVNMSNKLYMFDLKEQKGDVYFAFDEKIKLRTVNVLQGNKLLLADTYGNVYTFEMESKHVEIVWEGTGQQYGSCLCVNNTTLLVELVEKDYLEIGNVITKEKEQIKLKNVMHYEKWPHAVFSKAIICGSKAYLFSTQYRTLLQYDFETGTLIEMLLEYGEMSVEDIKKLIESSTYVGGIREGFGSYPTLETFLEVLLM